MHLHKHLIPSWCKGELGVDGRLSMDVDVSEKVRGRLVVVPVVNWVRRWSVSGRSVVVPFVNWVRRWSVSGRSVVVPFVNWVRWWSVSGRSVVEPFGNGVRQGSVSDSAVCEWRLLGGGAIRERDHSVVEPFANVDRLVVGPFANATAQS
jgi:hypothetical protein